MKKLIIFVLSVVAILLAFNIYKLADEKKNGPTKIEVEIDPALKDGDFFFTKEAFTARRSMITVEGHVEGSVGLVEVPDETTSPKALNIAMTDYISWGLPVTLKAEEGKLYRLALKQSQYEGNEDTQLMGASLTVKGVMNNK